jgi:hypothetical protein
MLCCLLRHETVLVYGETLRLVGCRRCGHVESCEPVWRPEADGTARATLEQEQAIRQARTVAERQQLFADRERRLAEMHARAYGPERLRRVR